MHHAKMPVMDVVFAVGLVTLLLGVPFLFLYWGHVRVGAGKALVVNKMDTVEVFFTTGMVMPLVHSAEEIDVSTKALSIDRRGNHGVICKDHIRADLRVDFHLKIRRTSEDVLRVAQAIGCARAGDLATLEELFVGRFADAIAEVAHEFDFEQLYSQRAEFRERLVTTIGEDLGGFVLEDVTLAYLEQTPVEALDPDNILDAKGIRKIVAVTAAKAEERAKIEHAARSRRLELDTLVAELEHRKADALGRFQRDHGRELTEERLRETIAALLVEHFGPRIDAEQAKALVDADSY